MLITSFALLFSTSLSANKQNLALSLEEINFETRFFSQQLKHISPSQYVSNKVWNQVYDLQIPTNHPVKTILDTIFSTSRALCDLQSMEAAGFEPAIPQHHTQIIVTKHPALKGYVIKAYLDVQEYHSGKPEHYFWVKRIKGAQLIKQSIKDHHYEHLLKVPQKWIYLLPDEPSPPPGYLRKMFILVAEDMNIYDAQTNEALWGSSLVTKELLKALYTVITKLGLFDCAKPANCPISSDGRIAFVDTQSYHAKHVKYQKLTPYLSPEMKRYWLKLIDDTP